MKTRLARIALSLILPLACCVTTAAWLFVDTLPLAAQEEAAAAKEVSPELEEAFKKMLNGATLVGHFTLSARDLSDLKEERYTIESVEKLAGGRWLFRSRIRYGDHDVTVPLPLPVKWAGDTPMIVVDELAIPGLGTFDARVMFFKDHYAGYWRHGEHGGHLFGVIQRDDEGQEKEGEAETEGADQE
jgi:hypothetical protein